VKPESDSKYAYTPKCVYRPKCFFRRANTNITDLDYKLEYKKSKCSTFEKKFRPTKITLIKNVIKILKLNNLAVKHFKVLP